MLLFSVHCNVIFQMVAGLPVIPKPCLVTVDRAASTLHLEMMEHLFHLQDDEAPTLRRKWFEKHNGSSKAYTTGCCFAVENRAGYEKETILAVWT